VKLQSGKLERPFLGVRYVTLNEETADQLNIDQTSGAYIPRGTDRNPSIAEDSPAQKAGLEPGDVIIEIDGEKLTEDSTLVSVLGSKRVGDSVEMKVIRNGQEKTLTVVLEAVPES
jgi:serine protease Do